MGGGESPQLKCLLDITSTFKPGEDWTSHLVGKEVESTQAFSFGYGPWSRRGG